MKKVLLYFLFFIYLISVVKPTLPFVTDAIAHAFLYQKHIATVHVINGKQHVHHQFVRESKKAHEENNGDRCKKINCSDNHLFLLATYKIDLHISIKFPTQVDYIHTASPFLLSDFPPPKI